MATNNWTKAELQEQYDLLLEKLEDKEQEIQQYQTDNSKLHDKLGESVKTEQTLRERITELSEENNALQGNSIQPQDAQASQSLPDNVYKEKAERLEAELHVLSLKYKQVTATNPTGKLHDIEDVIGVALEEGTETPLTDLRDNIVLKYNWKGEQTIKCLFVQRLNKTYSKVFVISASLLTGALGNLFVVKNNKIHQAPIYEGGVKE